MSQKIIILLVFVIALILRLALGAFSIDEPTYDGRGYDVRAMSILQDGIFGENGKSTSFKPPLYSFFLAILYRFFGHSYLAVGIIQSILGSLTCIIIYFIALEYLGRNTAFLCGLLAAGNISFIKTSGILSVELLSTLIISSIILFLIRLDRAPSLGKRIAIGFLVGLSTLNRSEMIFFLPLVYLGWLCLVCFKRYSIQLFLKNTFLTLAVFLMVVSLWTFRNWRIYHTLVPLTTSVGINLYSSYRPPEGKLFGFTADDETVKLSKELNNEVEESDFLVKETLKFIRSNFNQLPRLALLKFLFFWSIFDWEIIGDGSYNISFGFMLPFFIWAFLVNIRKWRHYFLLYLPLFYYQAMALIFYGSPRFRVPCEPFIIIFAAMGIIYFFQKFSSRIIPSLLVSMFLLMNVAGFLYAPLLKDYTRCLLTKTGLW